MSAIRKSNFTSDVNHNAFEPRYLSERIKLCNFLKFYDGDDFSPNRHIEKRANGIFRLIDSFITKDHVTQLINPNLSESIISDVRNIYKFKKIPITEHTSKKTLEHQAVNHDEEYYRRYILDIINNKSYISLPNLPFALCTLKSQLPSSNWYGGKSKHKTNLPTRMALNLKRRLDSYNLSFRGGRTEYYLQETNDDWRIVLHHHIVLPMFTVANDMDEYRMNMLIHEVTNACQRYSNERNPFRRNAHLTMITHLLQRALIPLGKHDVEFIKSAWEFCSSRYEYVDPTFHITTRVSNPHLNPLLEQNHHDVARVFHYIEKPGLFPLTPYKNIIRFIGKNDSNEPVVYQHDRSTRKTIPLEVPIRVLFDYYRNNSLARSNRFYGGICSKTHPLHKLFTLESFPFEAGKRLFQSHLNSDPSVLSLFSFENDELH